MVKLSERFKDWYGYGEGFKPGLIDAEFDVLVNEVTQLEADLEKMEEHKNHWWRLACSRLRAEVALKEIADSPYCNYENNEDGDYGKGVTDGHRLAAKIARKALKAGGE